MRASGPPGAACWSSRDPSEPVWPACNPSAAGAPAVYALGWPGLRHNRAQPAAERDPVKLVTAIVHNEDAANLVDALLEREFRATRLHSSGGFLKQGNATILVGVDDDKVDAVLQLIS